MKKSKLKNLLERAENTSASRARDIERLRKEKERLNSELNKWRNNAIEIQNKHANYVWLFCEALGVTKEKMIDAFEAALPGRVKEPYFDDSTVDECIAKYGTINIENILK